jgi:hypothetical protein
MMETEKMEVPGISNPCTVPPVAEHTSIAHQVPSIQEVAVAKTEKLDRHGPMAALESSPSKRVKPGPTTGLESEEPNSTIEVGQTPAKNERQKGVAPIKEESVFSTSRGN